MPRVDGYDSVDYQCCDHHIRILQREGESQVAGNQEERDVRRDGCLHLTVRINEVILREKVDRELLHLPVTRHYGARGSLGEHHHAGTGAARLGQRCMHQANGDNEGTHPSANQGRNRRAWL